MKHWSVPRLWEGEACAIVAGGPSVTLEAVDSLRGTGIRVIVINNSYMLAPWADVLYFCDERWWHWHAKRHELKDFVKRVQAQEAMIVTLDNLHMLGKFPFIRSVKNTGRLGLEKNNDSVRSGSNSGYQAINLAYHLGAKHIILLGYDMRAQDKRVHWHEEHPVPTPPTVFKNLMVPAYHSLAPELSKAGVKVDNCSENSALTVFPFKRLSEAIEYAQSTRADS